MISTSSITRGSRHCARAGFTYLAGLHHLDQTGPLPDPDELQSWDDAA